MGGQSTQGNRVSRQRPPETEDAVVTREAVAKVDPHSSGEGLDRRAFLTQAAALAFSGGVLAAFLEACTATKPVTPEPLSPPPPPAPFSPPPPPAPPEAAPLPPPALAPPPPPAPAPSPPRVALVPDRAKIGHLLRRAGFGAGKQELERFMDMGVEGTVDHLVDFEEVDDSALDTRLSGVNLNLDNLVDMQRWWFLRMIYTRRPLQEKMAFFWHGLLTSGFSKIGRGPYMLAQNQLFRRLSLAPYDEMLKAIARDPAMLIWLDSQVNKRLAPNENFARELMELFSMGIGPFNEGDVRESARAFTGWGLRQKLFYFTPEQHDSGTKSFLGRTGNFDGDDIIDIIMEHPAAAEFVTRKLFSFFVYDDPSPEVIAGLASTFRSSKYSIKEVMRQIFTSPEFYSPKAYRAKVKRPAEYIAATVRSLEIETDAAGLPGFSDRMGQALFNPFDVSGWYDGVAWINSNTLLQRLNFANTVVVARARNFQFSPLETARRLGLTSAEQVIDHFGGVLLDGKLSAQEKEILMKFSRLLTIPDDFGTGSAVTNLDEKLRALVYLILASPDYQLA